MGGGFGDSSVDSGFFRQFVGAADTRGPREERVYYSAPVEHTRKKLVVRTSKNGATTWTSMGDSLEVHGTGVAGYSSMSEHPDGNARVAIIYETDIVDSGCRGYACKMVFRAFDAEW